MGCSVRLIALSICVCSLGSISANQRSDATPAQNLPDDVREMARKVMMPIVYKVPGMDRVRVVQNLKYTKTEDPNILMDIYVPPDLVKAEQRPVVIFIHGGAKPEWTPKDWGIYRTWGRLIAASDLVGVTFTHRLEYPAKSLENAAQDVIAAINYVRANADKYSIDKDRICLIAYSAGGPCCRWRCAVTCLMCGVSLVYTPLWMCDNQITVRPKRQRRSAPSLRSLISKRMRARFRRSLLRAPAATRSQQ